MKLKIKNMVCDRCRLVLDRELTASGLQVSHIELGEIQLQNACEDQLPLIRQILRHNGFELIEDEGEAMVARVKALLVNGLKDGEITGNLSDFLARHMSRGYGTISKVFSSREGLTIEKYFILLKIEQAKEWIQLGRMQFSEIAYALNYSSSSHLSRQFKSVTGMSMSEYRELGNWQRSPLDQIVQKNSGKMKSEL